MQRFIVFTALLACAAAAPGLLLGHETPVVAAVHSAPILHTSVPVVAGKTTITKSSQVVHHGTPVVVKAAVPVVHAPIVHATPVVHAAPVVHAVHTVHAPVVVKTAPAAIAHSTSVVHHAPVVKAVPLVAVH